mgnify:FL=1
MFFAKFHKSNLVTYMGLVSGIMALFYSFSKMAFASGEYVRFSLACLVFSGVCDMLDGKFARMFKRTEEQKEIGVQLDSLCDTFCFLAVPVVFMMSLGMIRPFEIVVYAIFMLCGINRLASFNVVSSDKEKAINTYHGLPVTSTAITYPLLGLFHTIVPAHIFKLLYIILTLLTSILMVVNIKVPKLKGAWYIIIPALAVILITLLMVI